MAHRPGIFEELTTHLKELNISLPCENEFIYIMYQTIIACDMKLKLFGKLKL